MFTLKTFAPNRRGPLTRFGLGLLGALPVVLGALAVPPPAWAVQYTTLYNFAGGNDGCSGSSSLTVDSAGTLYGDTARGGGESNGGTVFSLVPGASSDSVLNSFSYPNGSPSFDLILDSAGNLYGVTPGDGFNGNGTIFKFTASRMFATLHYFNGSDGGELLGGLVADSAGNLYGTTNQYGMFFNGTVFKLAPGASTPTTLYNFHGGYEGSPEGNLVLDKAGNLYGTTLGGGTSLLGSVFELTTGGQLLTLHSFQGQSDGTSPSGLVIDAAGNLYGSASGANQSPGRIFKLTPNGTPQSPFTTLYSFKGGSDGSQPGAGALVLDSAGNLYGTTGDGGDFGSGTVFRLSRDSSGSPTTYETLASFPAGTANPVGLVLDGASTLYGTTGSGGTSSCGFVYSIAGAAAPIPKLTAFPRSLTFQFGTLGNRRSTRIFVSGGDYFPQTPLLVGPNADEFSITANSCNGMIASNTSCSIWTGQSFIDSQLPLSA